MMVSAGLVGLVGGGGAAGAPSIAAFMGERQYRAAATGFLDRHRCFHHDQVVALFFLDNFNFSPLSRLAG
jgi:hypothetical protein